MSQLTVLMTVFNGARFLREAVESILKQTHRDFEFLIVDNASSDTSVAIIESFQDPRIQLVRSEVNMGQTRALNLGLEQARGQFVARMDADDVSLPRRFEKQIAFLNKHPSAAVVGTWHDEIDEKGCFIKAMRYPHDPLEIKCHLLSDGDLTKRCIAHPTVMFRTAIVKKIGGYNESIRFAQDYELWTRLMMDHEIYNIPESLFQYRANKHSTSNKNRSEMNFELDKIVKANLRRLWPQIDERSETCLLSMLRNKKQPMPVELSELSQAFDHLYARLFNNRDLSSRERRFREQIKMYYLPCLSASAPISVAEYILSHMGIASASLVDKKFHKNIVKRLIRR